MKIFLLLLSIILEQTRSSLLTSEIVLSTQRSSHSSIAYGETVIYTESNKISSTNIFNVPYPTSSKLIPSSPVEENLYLAQSQDKIFAVNSIGGLFILDKLYSLSLMKIIELPVAGLSTFKRNQVHYFESTNFVFVASRDVDKKRPVYGDYTQKAEDFFQLTNGGDVTRFSCFEGNDKILSIENFQGKKIYKTLLNFNPPNPFASFTSPNELIAMKSVEKSGLSRPTEHLQVSYDQNFYKIEIYDSSTDVIALSRDLAFNAREVTDICIIKNTGYFILSNINPEKFIIASLSDLNPTEVDYGNGQFEASKKNILRSITYIENSDLVWMGKDRDIEVFKLNPPICQVGCNSCIDSVPGSCTDCGAKALISGFCADAACPLVNPIYYPEVDGCKSTNDPKHYCSGNLCRKCQLNCAVCDNSLNCQTCDNGFNLDTDKLCEKRCSFGFYSPPPTYLGCSRCHERCRQCNGEEESDCTVCYSLAPPIGSTCPDDCPSDEYFSVQEMRCKKCHENCSTCKDGGLFNCLTCAPNNFAADNPSIPGRIKCSPECNEGFYGDKLSWTCQMCKQECELCTEIDRCHACIPELLLFQNETCLEECPTGYTIYERNCVFCFPNCAECESPQNCLVCNEGYELVADGQLCQEKGINSLVVKTKIGSEKRFIGSIVIYVIFSLVAGGIFLKWWKFSDKKKKDKKEKESLRKSKIFEETERKKLNTPAKLKIKAVEEKELKKVDKGKSVFEEIFYEDILDVGGKYFCMSFVRCSARFDERVGVPKKG